DLAKILDDIFGDPHRRIAAKEGLHRLRQGNRDFTAYLTEFERYKADVDWNEKALKYHLQCGINRELDLALLSLKIDTTSLDEFIEQAIDTDSQIRRVNARHNSRFVAPTRTPARASGSSAATTSSASTSSAPSTSTQSTVFGTHAGPIDVFSSFRRLSPAEKA